jgi:hypothetical protein
MIRRNQFVLNSPHWSDTGLAVDDELTVNVATPDGRTVVCGCTGERPLVPPATVKRAANRPVADDHDYLPIPVLNFKPGG